MANLLKRVENFMRIPKQGLVPDSLDAFLGTPTIFTMIVITQGLFGGSGLQYTPNFIKKLQSNPVARVLFITLVAYTATSDAETAIVCTLVYFLGLHLMKTKEEKKKYPNIF